MKYQAQLLESRKWQNMVFPRSSKSTDTIPDGTRVLGLLNEDLKEIGKDI